MQIMAGESLDCPCCDRFAKVYKQKLMASMSWVLLWLYKTHGTEWVHVISELEKAGLPRQIVGVYAKLRHWRLLDKNEDMKNFYRVSEYGVRFVHDDLRVKESYSIYNRKVIRYDGPKISIRESFGNKFDYDEIMLPEVIMPIPTLFDA